ncbi:phosphonoacetaldehyde hydrolase [Paenibacillus swuensis]|uniref:Phosphonoacetaldehyde hydrolase n=1 Tax=Paenibacillus swuensis TaxID=1178515 RepID=A0A172TFP0_9BACL|nr:phosphonoacetaldehyde hydrolase [Paenibacillus swuensis]ANE45830.1 phosphonoacetaldehyde hydrolase [Paenibacillus swuensis]
MTQQERIKAVILDWAGTVIDYGCFAPMHAFIQVFEEAGVRITTREARIPMGMLKWDHIEAILQMERIKVAWADRYGKEAVKEDVDRLYVRFETILMESLQTYTDPIPGALETVNQLREAGIAIGSTTGYTSGMMETIVPEAKRKGYSPDYWIASDQVKAGRPYPYMIFQNLNELGIFPPSAVIKVGDTVSDVLEGKNAGVWTVAVIRGSSELGLTEEEVYSLPEDELAVRLNQARRTFEEAGADYVIGSIHLLPSVIDEIERTKLERTTS